MTMLSGTYYVGDLCYILHNEWKEVCDLIIREHTCLDGEFNLKDGRRFAIYSTAYGDGHYTNNINNIKLSVDSGSIGCIKVDDIDQSNPDNRIDYGMVVEFDTPFETSGYTVSRSEWDGTIHIGHVEVYTDYQEEEEYDNYYDDEDYSDEERYPL